MAAKEGAAFLKEAAPEVIEMVFWIFIELMS